MKIRNIKDLFITTKEDFSSFIETKYSLKNDNSIREIERLQKKKLCKKNIIKPLQFIFEITNRCNCNCPHCGMAANKIEGKSSISENELKKIIDDIEAYGIPAFAITGGEPFLEFEKICFVLDYSKGKADITKIISNGFWGNDVELYFNKLIKSGLFNNRFFIPTIQISIGEQTVPLESVCNIINYVANNFSIEDIHLGIIHGIEQNLKISKLDQLYNIYLKKFGSFPKDIIYLSEGCYYNANPLQRKIQNVQTDSVYNLIEKCDNRFTSTIGKVIEPKIFMNCNGLCYPCDSFNKHMAMSLGNYFNDGLEKILENFNKNKYVNFIKDFGTEGFRDIIPFHILEENFSESICQSCDFCIDFCEKNKLLR